MNDGGCGNQNQGPVANLTACTPTQLMTDPDCLQGATASASFNHSTINPMVITLSGATSTDDASVTEYRFTLLPPVPPGASMALANNNQRTMQRLTELTVPAGTTGTFRIGLEVWDACATKSANTSIITVNIYP